MRIHDADTGESKMDIVAIPEGFSFQAGYIGPHDFSFISVIVSHSDADELVTFLRDNIDSNKANRGQ